MDEPPEPMEPAEADLLVALSELWVDRALQAADHARLADAVRRSGLDAAAVEALLRADLGPLLGANLRSPVGEWTGFDPTWLLERVRLGRARRGAWSRLVARAPWTLRGVRQDWERVRRLAYGHPRRSDAGG